MGRTLFFVLVFAVLLPACSGNKPPAFCGVMDAARIAVADVSPNRYPDVAGQQVGTARRAAKDLTGAESALALKVANDLQAASKAKAGSFDFTNRYNKFVRDSNEFIHRYCNVTEPPD